MILVATGPMTVTFILALTIGAAKGLGGKPMLDGWNGSNGCFGIGTFSIDVGFLYARRRRGIMENELTSKKIASLL